MKWLEEIKKIEQHAALANNTVRHVETIKPRQAVRQGDIYLVRIDRSTAGLKRLDFQKLVPGTTQGSRHFTDVPAQLSEDDGKTISGISPLALRGPVVDAPERFTVSHPEHAHISLPAGTYQVLYQLDFQSQQRVAD